MQVGLASRGTIGPGGDRRGRIRRAGGLILAAVVIGCSTAPSATPTPLATARPVANGSPAPSALPSEIPSPEASSSAAPATVPPASGPPATPNPNVQGTFDLLPASPRADFDIHIECSGSIGQTDPVAIVWLKGTDGYTLRDYADIAHPHTACSFGTGDWSIVQLIDPRHIVIVDEEATDTFAVVDLPHVRFHWFHLPKTKGWGSELITVGPALDRIVWKQVDPDSSRADTIYLSTANRTRVLATLPDTNLGRCGSLSDSAPGRYTVAGDYLFVLNAPLEYNSSLLIFKGRETLLSIVPAKLEWAHQANAPSMAVWSPVSPTLYWSRGGDVWRWTPGGGQQRFIAGVAWFNPTISADGRYLAYAVLNADLKSHVYLVDLTGDAVPHRIGDGQRAGPRFLNSTQLFYLASDSGGGCTGGPSAYRIYNVTSGSEDGSIIEGVRAAWPATSANL